MKLETLLDLIRNASRASWVRDDEVGIATLTADVNVTVRELRDRERQLLNEPWATKHADQEAVVCQADLYYGAAFVRRYWFAAVDGARASIPYPKSRDELVISREQYGIATAIDFSEGLDKYLKKSGITVA